jgi:hypothetical protein
MGAQGTATIDFGIAPATKNFVTVPIADTNILSDSLAEAFMMGDSTADHNATEHAIVPIKFTCVCTAGVGFVITAFTEWRLTGTFTVHWVWN